MKLEAADWFFWIKTEFKWQALVSTLINLRAAKMWEELLN
jgi:hypothetical protein